MNAKNRFTEAIAALIHQTQDGVLKWEPRPPGDGLGPEVDALIETLFVAKRDPWLLRLYSYKTGEATGWEHKGVALEVSEQGKTSWWRFPHEAAIWDLLDAVRFREARVHEFIDTLLMPF